MQENILNKKLSAARILGLDVVEEYKTVDGNNFTVVSIKKEDTVIETFLAPLDKQTAIIQLTQQKADLTNVIELITNKIVQLEAMK